MWGFQALESCCFKNGFRRLHLEGSTMSSTAAAQQQQQQQQQQQRSRMRMYVWEDFFFNQNQFSFGTARRNRNFSGIFSGLQDEIKPKYSMQKRIGWQYLCRFCRMKI
jgi:hypothetical protein